MTLNGIKIGQILHLRCDRRDVNNDNDSYSVLFVEREWVGDVRHFAGTPSVKMLSDTFIVVCIVIDTFFPSKKFSHVEPDSDTVICVHAYGRMSFVFADELYRWEVCDV